MSIARDISRQTRRSILEVTSSNAGTNFTVSGGFSGSSLDVYLNGAKLIINSDYSLNGTSGIILNQAAVAGDIIEFVSRNTSSVINVVDTSAIIDEAVTFDKLSDSATESNNVQKRVAKAWVNFTGTGTVTRNAWFNVSSITDNNIGDYSVNFATPFGSANDYAACVTASCQNGTSAIPTVHQFGVTTASTGGLFRFRISEGNSYATYRDSDNIYVIVFGE